jgi:PilZ domain
MMEAPQKTINGQNPPNPAQKRSCPRYPFSPAVEAIDDQASFRIRGRRSDISRNGCYTDMINPFAAKSVVSLVITKDNQLFKTRARVIYSQIGMGMGLLFTTADPDQLLLLGTWLAELNEGKHRDTVAPAIQLPADTSNNTDHDLRNIFIELVTLLSRKNIMNDSEGMALLRKLSK